MTFLNISGIKELTSCNGCVRVEDGTGAVDCPEEAHEKMPPTINSKTNNITIRPIFLIAGLFFGK
jgi:hypothetical protein